MIGWKPSAPTLWHRIFGNKNIASVRYRCLLPLAELQKSGFPVELYRKSNRDQYKAVLFSKTYGPQDQELAMDLRRRGRGVLLDICDNHFYNPNDVPRYRRGRQDLLKMITLADQVSCSTQALARIVAAEAGLKKTPLVVADPVDPAMRAEGLKPRPGRPRLLWFGAHGVANAPCGMEDLLRVSQNLERLSRRRDFELVVASNDRSKFRRLIAALPFPTSYIPWRLETFPELLSGAWAALIPVTLNPFTECKSSNRLAAALFAGIPVVADAIPSYREFAPFAYLDDWDAGLDAVFERRPQALAKAAQGREYLSQKYLPGHMALAWERVLAPWI